MLSLQQRGCLLWFVCEVMCLLCFFFFAMSFLMGPGAASVQLGGEGGEGRREEGRGEERRGEERERERERERVGERESESILSHYGWSLDTKGGKKGKESP